MAEVLESRRLLATYFWLNGPATQVPEGAVIGYSVGWYCDAGNSPGGTVEIAYSGSAAGGDCETPISSVMIPANSYGHPASGQSTFYVEIKRDNEVEEEPEELTVTLSSSSPGFVRGTYGYPPFLDPTPLLTKTMTIQDDPPIVNISVIDGTGAETEAGQTANGARLLVTRTGGDTETPIEVSLGYSGTATQGSDYTASGGTTLSLLTSATVDLAITNDEIDEGDETIIATVADGGNTYKVGNGIASALAKDNDYTVTVSPASPVTVKAGNWTTVTVTVTQGGKIQNVTWDPPGMVNWGSLDCSKDAQGRTVLKVLAGSAFVGTHQHISMVARIFGRLEPLTISLDIVE